MNDEIPSYAVAYLRDVEFGDVEFGDDVIQYMREVDDTFKPFGGEFIVHGGDLDGTLVIIRFPDRDSAIRWYESADYQRILPLRLNNSISMMALVEGVTPGHTGSARVDDILAG